VHDRRLSARWLTLTAGITTPVEAVVRRLARFLARHGETEVMPLLDRSNTEHLLPRDEQLHLITTALGRARRSSAWTTRTCSARSRRPWP
jgi:hypothetical protein